MFRRCARIAFLSGGQSEERPARTECDERNRRCALGADLLLRSALQATPLSAWSGQEDNAEATQSAFAHRALCNGQARLGRYSQELEHA